MSDGDKIAAATLTAVIMARRQGSGKMAARLADAEDRAVEHAVRIYHQVLTQIGREPE